jgi:hypothetical protein
MVMHVVILAQGQQKRLPDLEVPKQMLELPACDGVAIIERTLCQLAYMAPSAIVTVVCGGPMMLLLPIVGAELVQKTTGRRLNIGSHQLADPGNSSLKGIARYLQTCVWSRFVPPSTSPVTQLLVRDPYHPEEGIDLDQIVVLLGDVVYSWACLGACLLGATPSRPLCFVGTSDLSRSGGELWGLTWDNRARSMMHQTLQDALERHPPFEEYQPGQMRRWLWEVDKHMDGDFRGEVEGGARRTWFTAIDDYTRDIDLPEHVAALGELSRRAAVDDQEYGLRWHSVVEYLGRDSTETR